MNEKANYHFCARIRIYYEINKDIYYFSKDQKEYIREDFFHLCSVSIACLPAQSY